MSIKRYACYTIRTNAGKECMMEATKGPYVLYTDHLAAQASPWRSDMENAPKVCDPSILLAAAHTEQVWMDYWDEDSECWANQSEYELPYPTHWMPLPSAPKENKP